jgi:hypothetical protein
MEQPENKPVSPSMQAMLQLLHREMEESVPRQLAQTDAPARKSLRCTRRRPKPKK